MFLQVISRFILTIMGWQEPKLKYPVVGKCVAIYPHSSYWDFILVSLYLWGYPELFNGNVRILITERFSWLFFFMDHLIPAPDRFVRYFMQKEGYSKSRAILTTFKYVTLSLFSERYSLSKICDTSVVKFNTIDFISGKLSLTPNFIFLISPSGSISSEAWKSGYKTIAQKLNADILVAGISYSKKTIISTFRYKALLNTQTHTHTQTQTQTQTTDEDNIYLEAEKNLSSSSSPADQPEDIDAILKPYFESIGTIKNSTAIDYPTFTSFICSCLISPLIFKVNFFAGLVGIATSIISLYYHYTQETCFHQLDLFSSIFTAWMIYFLASDSVEVLSLFNCLIFSAGTFFLGRSWHCNRPRKENYHINHSFFHIFTSLACYMLLNDVIDYYNPDGVYP
jgi:hypothetical protein